MSSVTPDGREVSYEADLVDVGESKKRPRSTGTNLPKQVDTNCRSRDNRPGQVMTSPLETSLTCVNFQLGRLTNDFL